jgi:integrase
MGYHYQRKQRDGTKGGVWWVQYYSNGKRMRESTHTKKETEAKRFLKEREGRVVTGQIILPRADRIPYEELASDLWQHYEATGQRNLKEAATRLNPLGTFFRGYRVANIFPTEITKYVIWRHEQGISNSTINRELAVLTKMFNLGYERGKVLRLPVIHKLKETPPRQGFFERDQFVAIRRQLPEHLWVALTIAYTYGWRMQSEVLTLERRHIDLETGTIRLDPGTTKNDEGRIVYLIPELKVQLEVQLRRVDELGWKLGRIVPFLFPHFTGRFQGQRLHDFRKAWKTACRRAGCPGFLRHDFRRTAVRNMVNAGVVERVAMTVTGHKTRSVFDRYHIVSPSDLQDVVRKLTGTISGTP